MPVFLFATEKRIYILHPCGKKRERVMRDTMMMSKDGMDEVRRCSHVPEKKRIHALPLRILIWRSNREYIKILAG